MKYYLCLILLFCLGDMAMAIEPSTQPNECQQRLIDRGYGMFIHFGINTFNGLEWSDGTTPASAYNPTQLDCDQWIRVARDAGFRYVVLTAKHHDGFCLWDSALTDYDVASSPVKTDVVGAVAEACRKYGLQFALYYSLWDRHEPSYQSSDFSDYIRYMEGQLIELMSNYGEVCELWFDGGWDKPAEQWRLPELYSLVKKLQPQCAIGVNGNVTDHEGDEGGYCYILPDQMIEDDKYVTRYFPVDFRLWDPKIAHAKDKKQYLYDGKSYYLPFEHTICLSKAWNWFQKSQPMPVRSQDELAELFYRCTANDNTLLINVPPSPQGLIYPHEADAIISLGQRLGIRQGEPLPKAPAALAVASASATSVWEDNYEEYGPMRAVDGGMQTRWASTETTPTLTIDFDSAKSIRQINIFEYCDSKQGADGFSNERINRIQRYAIDALDSKGDWTTIYLGDEPMGDCKTISLAQPYTTNRVRLRVLQASAPPSIYLFDMR
ncbi:MAG: alpha-L-fucosidase [Bacteroidales bacterium]|nr:alpha-L-fucosidase [Bacteroidales bacterium]